ncbi:MAG TPA: hypothetical protein VK628_06475 [Flavitalea sp.]|nr:hypothetical protein [Flavitalea sp.]
MKLYSLLPSLLLISSMSLMAQKKKSWKNDFQDSTNPVFLLKKEPRFTVNVHGGYAFALGSTFKFYPDDVESIDMKVIENNDPVKNTQYKAPTRGLGQGLRVGAGISYIINDFINIGLDIDYFSSIISKNRDSSFYQLMSGGMQGSEYSYKERVTTSYDATLLTFSPNITFKAVSRPRFFIYNKVGLVVTVRPNSLQKEKTSQVFSKGWQGFFMDSTSQSEKTYEWGIRNPSIGFMGGIGAQVRITEKIRAFAELQFSHIVFVVRARTLTSYTVDGQELVSSLPVSDKELKFERNLSSDQVISNPDQPMRTIIQRIPITYVGMQAGIALRF